MESHKVQKYLPDFFEKLREDLRKELRGQREHDQPEPRCGIGDHEHQRSLCVSVSESDVRISLDPKLAGCGTNNLRCQDFNSLHG